MFSGAKINVSSTSVTVPMFSALTQILWFLVLACTLTFELVPLSAAFEAQFSWLAFHSYEGAKLVLFFAFGFLTPIAWWRYKTLSVGVLFAIVTTATVELGQGIIPGHRTSPIELAVKLVLLFTGFAAALDMRKYQQCVIGRLCIHFSSRYW